MFSCRFPGSRHFLAWRLTAPAQFSAVVSIAILAVPVVGGLGSVSGAVAGSVLLYAPAFFIGPSVAGLFGRSPSPGSSRAGACPAQEVEISGSAGLSVAVRACTAT